MHHRGMNLAAIELRHLRYFVGVVEQGSFRGAALRLHVSQPPLTRQVQQLEDALGVQLLERKPRGVELTAAGQVFFDEARNILTLTEQAASRAKLAGLGQLGRLDVGVFGSAVFDTIPRIIQAFRAAYPRVEVVLHNLDRAGQLRALRERRITVGFNRFFVEEPDLHWKVIQSERIHVALPSAHPLASKRQLSLKQLCEDTLVLYPRQPRPSFIDLALRRFSDRDLKVSAVHEVDDVVTAVALVSSGFGVSLVTDSACNLQLPGVTYLPLAKADEMRFELSMIHRREDSSALLKAFLGTVQELGEELNRDRRA